MADDVITLLERMEELVTESPRIPLTAKAIVDEEELFAIIDEIKEKLPEELREARWVARERERLLGEARQQAELIQKEARERSAALVAEAERRAESVLREAQVRADRLTSDHAITKKAEEQAQRIIKHGQDVAEELHRNARQYAAEVLGKLEAQMERSMLTVRQSREELLRTMDERPAGKAAQ